MVVGAGHLEPSSLVVEHVRHVILHRGEQVCVAERDVGRLVTHALGDSEGGEALVDEQAHVAVAQVVHADPLDPALLAAVLHCARDLVLGDREHAVAGANLGVTLEVVGDLLDQGPRELDGSDRLGRLRVREYVPAVEALVGLVDAHGPALQVEGRRHEREHLSLADPGPVEDLEHEELPRPLHHLVGELEVLLLGPELHLGCFLAAHFHGARRGVGVEPVVAGGVVEDGRKLVVHGAQVRGCVALPVVVSAVHEAVLPADDVDALDLAHATVLEVRHGLRPDQVVLVAPGVLAQARPHVGLVHLVELLERHGHRAPGEGDEIVFPCLGLLRGREAALALVHFLAELILAPELREPGPVPGLLNGHASPLLYA